MANALTDLHMHSSVSDGTLTPSALAALCAERGVRFAALTDHDSCFGVHEFVSECHRLSIRALTGIEFSAYCELSGERIPFHLLGYGFDPSNTALCAELSELQEKRVDRILRYVARLRAMGVEITDSELSAAVTGTSPGRPHLAHMLVEKGLASSIGDAFKRYLPSEGIYQQQKIAAEKAARLLTGAGGIAVIAHPGRIRYANIERLAQELKSHGISGIEVFYPTHSDAQILRFSAIARANSFFVTTGSDFHDPVAPPLPGGETRSNSQLIESLAFLTEREKQLGNTK